MADTDLIDRRLVHILLDLIPAYVTEQEVSLLQEKSDRLRTLAGLLFSRAVLELEDLEFERFMTFLMRVTRREVFIGESLIEVDPAFPIDMEKLALSRRITLGELNLPERLLNAIGRALTNRHYGGFDQIPLYEVISRTEEELLRWRNLGSTGVSILKDRLAHYGFTLRSR